MIPKNNLLLLCTALTAVFAAQVASAQLVTNTVQNSQGVGVRTTDLANPPAATYPQQFDKAVTRGYNNDPSKAWIQFDLSSAWATYGQGNLVSAALTLWGENGPTRSFNVFGLADSAGLEGWNMVTTYWTNAPGNDVASANGFALANVYGGAVLWPTSGGVDLARPDLGGNFDQCARYTSPEGTVNDTLKAFLATDTDGKVTFMWTGGNNQNWWVGTNGMYTNDISLGYTSTNTANGTFGDVIRDSPTLTLVFTNAPVNAPVFTDIMRVGGNLILQGTNGVPQGAYQMLRSTDLSQPVASWSGLGINSFEANGHFNFTNALPANAASFYRLMTLSSGPVFPPAITEQPQDFATSVGNNATFNVTATGTAPLLYQWYFNTNTALNDQTNTALVLSNVQTNQSGTYSMTVTNLYGTDYSTFATLLVTNSTQPPGISDQPDNQNVNVGQTVNFSVTAYGALPLHYQWYYNTSTLLLDETNNALTLLNVTTNQAGTYSVTVTNLYGTTNSVFATLNVIQEVLAFPTAEGYGKYTTGGRGGAVYEVTTLNPTGPGSLGAAIGASGPRTVVFRVAGTITGNFNISKNDITIAGQSAPGDGICIKGNLSTSADNIIIRYIRVRYDPTTMINGDALGGRYHKNIIFDHVSTSWSADEVLTLYFNENTTVQWCIIAEGCEKFEGGVSVGHRFGGIWGNNFGTWHHNLIAHNDSRNPRWASGCGYNDYRNNVIYNWGYESCYGGEKEQPGDANHTNSTINMIANYYKPGPATIANGSAVTHIANPSARSSTDKGDWYVSGNYFDGNSGITANNWIGVVGGNYNQLSAPWAAMPINQQTPQDAYLSVLDGVGCSFPNRDQVDVDIIDDVRNGTAQYGNNGIISVPADVGGWPTLASGTSPVDNDHDGMPASWEAAHGLSDSNYNDRNNIAPSGYTMLETYLNELAP